MKKFLIALVVFFLAGLSNAQIDDTDPWIKPKNTDYPKVAVTGALIKDFVPSGFQIVKKTVGDLNADGASDAVLVIKGTSKRFLNPNSGLGDDIFDTNPRILIILFKDKIGGKYRLARQSDTFIVPPDSPVSSEPFQNISISHGVLKLDFELWQSAGSWFAENASYKFRYQEGEFQLIGADTTEVRRNTGDTETRSYNFLTNRVKISKGNYSDNKRDRITWKTLPRQQLKTLITFPAPFEWEIEPDIFI